MSSAKSPELKKLQKLTGTINPERARDFGPVGVANMFCIVSKSEQADELPPLFPWIFNNQLAGSIEERERVVVAAIENPALHGALAPYFPALMSNSVNQSDSAYNFLQPAHALAAYGSPELIDAAKPFFPEALSRVSGSPQSYGNLACDWLDIGGHPQDLLPSANYMKTSVEQRLSNSPYRSNLCAELCHHGFVRFITHPQVMEYRPLNWEFKNFSGVIVDDCKRINNKKVVLLGGVLGSEPLLYFREMYRSASPLWPDDQARLGDSKNRFVEGLPNSRTLADAGCEVFKKLSTVPARSVSAPSHRALKDMRAALRQC